MKRILRNIFIALMLSILAGCSSNTISLINDISEIDANEIVAALYVGGIESRKVMGKDQWSVSIAPEDMANAVGILKTMGLPAQKHVTLGEVFKKEGMISTPLEERARYIYALSQELASTISQIDGVLVTRVHIVLPSENSIGVESQSPSAAVFIKHLQSLDPDTVTNKIERLIVRSVPGLTTSDADSVSVNFIESVRPVAAVDFVDIHGFRMTDASAMKMHKIISVMQYIVSILLVLCGIYVWKRVISTKRDMETSEDSSVDKELEA